MHIFLLYIVIVGCIILGWLVFLGFFDFIFGYL